MHQYCNNHNHHHPCLHCNPHGYIRTVQHLIERCLLMHMTRDQCIKALAEHANIRPLITLTVWHELQKENKDFFQAYAHANSPRTLLGILSGYQGYWQEENNGNDQMNYNCMS